MSKRLIVYPDAPAEIESLLTADRRRRLAALGDFEYHIGPPKDADEFIERVAGADAIIAGWAVPVAAFAAAPKLVTVAFTGIGAANFVDLDAARRHGVTVTNTPGYADCTVAEHTMGLMIDVARNISRLDRHTRAGGWSKDFPGKDLYGCTLGLVGFGGIGQRVATIAQAFGMTVQAWTRTPDSEREQRCKVRFVELDDLLGSSDVVSVHLAHKPETEGLIDAARIAKLKPGALFINTARAEIVDETALVDALSKGRLRGAGIDVFGHEPLPEDHPFRRLDNVAITPHTAYNTPTASSRIFDIAIDNLAQFFAGRATNVVES